MGLEFLARVRRTSLWLGGVAVLMTITYAGLAPGLGAGAGVVWSLVNLALIEALVVTLTGPSRGTPAATLRAALAAFAMLVLFGAGAWLLASLPPVWLLVGFLLPYAVLIAKAASLLIVGSKAWAAFTRHPRRSSAVLAVVAIAAWAALALWPMPGAAPARATATTVTEAQEHESAHAVEAHAEGESEGTPKFANFITVIVRAFPNASWAHWLHEWEVILFALLIAGIIALVSGLAAAKGALIPGRFQATVEWLFEYLREFIVGILGEKHGPRYVPFLGTLFIYILCMNLAGLIPFFESPTSNLNVTVALALTVFVYAQYVGFRELGVVGWLDHLAGNPRTAISWIMVPLMLPIHILGEFAKPVSLAARLFGNVFGEDMLLVAFASIGISALAATGLPFGIPFHLPFLFLAMLTSAIQAMVFTVLSTIYILLMLPHEHEHEHEGAVQHAH